MTTATELLRQGRRDEVWRKYCSFLDLSLPEFMQIQEELLLEQIQLLAASELGRKLLGDRVPESVDDFRQNVPLTTYQDYLPYVPERREDVLPRKPMAWAHTSGRSGEYDVKWVPYTKRMFERLGEVAVGSMILASCSGRGEVYLEPGDRVLLATAPPPYVSGLLSHSTGEQMAINFLPSLEEGERMEYGERIAAGFEMAMISGLDYFYGIASVLARIGEQFEQGSGSSRFSLRLLRPDVLLRLVRGMLVARVNKRSMLPRDIWRLKGIMTGGTDTDIYKDRIEHFWGKKPLEGYACTEGGTLAMQAWNYQGMTFIPDGDFLEFIPYQEHLKNKQDSSYLPKTSLMDELEPGIYELVFTNFHGGIFTRYRVGDLFEVISLGDEQLEINLPQVDFYSRSGDLIDLAGFAYLTEKSIWQAIEVTGVDYQDWTARKEVDGSKPILHLYIELSPSEERTPQQVEALFGQGLQQTNSDYADMERMLGDKHLRVTHLRPGAFANYMDEQRRAGADLAHTKPPHMQPGDEVLERLLLYAPA